MATQPVSMLTLISGPAELSYSRNPIAIQLQTTALDSTVLLDIFDDYGNKLITLQGRPDSGFIVNFEISSILDTLVEFDAPQIGDDITTKTKIVSKYYCIATEYDANLAILSTRNIGWDGSTASLWVIKGGLNNEASGQDIFSFLTSNQKFLTWRTKYRATKSQQVFLYYLSQFTEDMDILATVYFTDGTSGTKTIGTKSLNKYDILSINAGYNSNLLDQEFPNRVPYKYILSVEKDATTRASIEIQLDDEDYFEPITILNPNSLGGFDSNRFDGAGTAIQNTNKKIAERNYAYNVRDFSFGNSTQKGYEIASGYKSKEEIDALTDFLNLDGYQVVNSQLVPVIADKSTKLKINVKNGLNAVTIKFTRANKNKNYTPDGFLS